MGHTVITGGSSGIGLALARKLGARGERISLIARRTTCLEAARRDLVEYGIHADAIALASADVCDASTLQDAVSHCCNTLGEADSLIVSAGIVEPNLFHKQTAAVFDRQIVTNMIGATNAVRALYPDMMRRKTGKILIVASGASYVGIPGYSAYCAAKHGLRGFAGALRLEAAPYGVSVSVCFPPDTLTPQFEREIEFRPHEAKLFIGHAKPWKVDRVADAILRGMDRGQRNINFSPTLSFLAYFSPIIEPVLQSNYIKRMKASSRISP